METMQDRLTNICVRYFREFMIPDLQIKSIVKQRFPDMVDIIKSSSDTPRDKINQVVPGLGDYVCLLNEFTKSVNRIDTMYDKDSDITENATKEAIIEHEALFEKAISAQKTLLQYLQSLQSPSFSLSSP